MSRPTVFVSYSRQDLRVLKGLLPFLDTLERADLIEIWSDQKQRGGELWREELNAAMNAATVAVLLISQEFLASKFIYEEELPRILERQTKGVLAVLPVFLSPSTVKSDEIPFTDAHGRDQRIVLSDIHGFGTPERPLNSLKPTERKRIFVELHNRIHELASQGGRVATSRESQLRSEAPPKDLAVQRPRIRHIPFLRNRNFIGRESYLRSLHDELKTGKPDLAIQALAGLGGIGKTQLALEYSYRYETDYDVLWWIRAEYDHTIREDLQALGAAVGTKPETDPEQPVKETLTWLNSHGDWLLVFDNAEHPDVIGPLLPQSNRGHVIITSRYPAWGAIARVQRIGVWKPKEAVDYLSRRTGLAGGKTATEMASSLGRLPLALAQAAGYIEETGSGFDGYLDLLHRQPAEALKLTANSSAAKKAVATVWDIALERVGASNPAAVDLLNLFSFLPSDAISRSLLVDRADRLPPRLRMTVRDRLAFDAAIGALRRYSLIDATPEEFSVHRLVQTVVQARLDIDSRRVFFDAATALAVKPAPRVDAPRLWPDRTVPLFLSADLGSYASLIRDAVAHYQERTVLRFKVLAGRPEEPGASYLSVRKGDGDSSAVGMIGGQQFLTVSVRAGLGTIIHSLGHSVGLWHEHSRADRDKYVAIIWENIPPAAHHNFNIHLSGHEEIRPYDYGSIMHDPPQAFSSNGRPTIVPKEDVEIGQRTGLSDGDVFLINALYANTA